MRLIVTRPEPDDDRTARALIRLGHEAILSPMLDVVIDAKAKIPARPYQAVLATSSNAVRALAGRAVRPVSVEVPLLAVGDQTALEAKRSGFSAARSAGGALDDLVALVGAELSPAAGPLLYAAGEEQAGDLAGRLQGQGLRCRNRDPLSDGAARAARQGRRGGVEGRHGRRRAPLFAAERGGVCAGGSRRRPRAAREEPSPASAFRRHAPSLSPRSRRAISASLNGPTSSRFSP